MAGTYTLPGVLLSGIHSGRPAASAVAGGTLYAETDTGQTYQSDGASTWTAWGAVAGGGGGGAALVLLEQHTASTSASLDFTTFISSTYDNYLIEIVELALATNGESLLIEMGTGGGPTWDTGNNYEWSRGAVTTGGTGAAATDFASTGVCRLFTHMANGAGYGIGQADLTVTGLQSTSHRKTIQGTLQYVTSDYSTISIIGFFGMQWTNTSTAVTGIRFIPSSGNIASGTIRVYGIAKV